MLPRETGTFFISKYALTKGVIEEQCPISYDGLAAIFEGIYLRIGCYAHETREAAVAAAEKMRIEKIASLEKQLKELRTMTFN